MASSNLLQWNPNQTNQLSDAAYTADASRSGGAGTGAVYPSATHNKFAYQVSTFVAAFGAMMASKGYNTSDADINALSGVLANLITNADQNSPLVAVSYSSTLALDFSHANGFQVALSGDVTQSTFANVSAGQQILCVIQQDSSGGHAFAWGSNVVNAGTVDPTPNSTSIQVFVGLADGSLHPLTPMTVS